MDDVLDRKLTARDRLKQFGSGFAHAEALTATVVARSNGYAAEGRISRQLYTEAPVDSTQPFQHLSPERRRRTVVNRDVKLAGRKMWFVLQGSQFVGGTPHEHSVVAGSARVSIVESIHSYQINMAYFRRPVCIR